MINNSYKPWEQKYFLIQQKYILSQCNIRDFRYLGMEEAYLRIIQALRRDREEQENDNNI